MKKEQVQKDLDRTTVAKSVSSCCETHTHHDHSHDNPPPHTAASTVAPLTPSADQELTQFYIAQMDCPVEEQLIRSKLETKMGVVQLQFNLMQRRLDVVHAQGLAAEITRDLTRLGMAPQQIHETQAPTQTPSASYRPLVKIGIAVGLALAAEGMTWLDLSAAWVLPVALASLLLSGLSIYKKGWIALANRNLNINALMSIAVTGAVLIGSWAEAAMVMSLFALAELIEARSLDRVRHAVDGLLNLAPEQVEVLTADGQWQLQHAQQVPLGAVVRVMPGARIGLDGVVQAGRSVVNQAPITGESVPVDKQEGDEVFAGSINGFGELQFITQGTYDNTLLVRIALAVQNAQQGKAPVQRFVDQFSRVYTPIVTLVALALAVLGPWVFGGAWLDWVYKALVLLVIACPCALVISTPVAVVSALTRAARMGLLIKGGVYLEQARHLRYLALDKTGTLTVGQPQLQDHWLAANADQALALAYSLAQRSDHPASVAVAEGLSGQGLNALPLTQFEAIPGAGVQGLWDATVWRLGKLSWMPTAALLPDALQDWVRLQQQRGASLVFLGSDQQIWAAFAVLDQIKPAVAEALHQLQTLGVQVEMLSGDNQAAVQHVAQQVGLQHAQGDLLPEDKQRIVSARTQRGVTGMVGDGINDAPALAQASIGFAMGALGTDMAIETADVAIMNDDLRQIPRTIRLSQRLHQILVQNISVALGIKAVFLVMALMGSVTMWMAVFADVGASLLVIANSLRLLKLRVSA
ncbi:MAG TPA: cation-translocating P-type ATPase [Paenalcaligenes hominis]|uniref:P-type Zn(2+) transporter n=1 Tax=Paenalcaligenes hominis TaxID=643674 RepID=A0A9D2VGC8_9BURK|nr:cation-translocating P-type ATPase [Paenalcaligenes hominis]